MTVHYRTDAPDPDELRSSYDLVLASDGLNSQIRTKYADRFGPSLDRRHNKYIWFGTDLVFEAFQFFVKQTEWGTMQIHGYPYSDVGLDLHRGDARGRLAPRRPRPHRGARASLPASRTSTPSSASRRSSPTSCRATRSSPTTPSG